MRCAGFPLAIMLWCPEYLVTTSVGVILETERDGFSCDNTSVGGIHGTERGEYCSCDTTGVILETERGEFCSSNTNEGGILGKERGEFCDTVCVGRTALIPGRAGGNVACICYVSSRKQLIILDFFFEQKSRLLPCPHRAVYGQFFLDSDSASSCPPTHELQTSRLRAYKIFMDKGCTPNAEKEGFVFVRVLNDFLVMFWIIL
jgi:hypothetical protein